MAPFLSAELILLILQHIPDVFTLFSAILTCKDIYAVFVANEDRIMKSLSLNEWGDTQHYGLESDRLEPNVPWKRYKHKKEARKVLATLFRQLIFMVNIPEFSRGTTRRFFVIMWQLFQLNDAEELLIPVAMRLAQTFVQREQELEAVGLLQAIWDSEHPFAPRQRVLIPTSRLFQLLSVSSMLPAAPNPTTIPTHTLTRPPTLLPLGSQLMCLLGQDHQSFSSLQEVTSEMKRKFILLPVVKIGWQRLSYFEGLTLPDAGFEKDGIHFCYRREKRKKYQRCYLPQSKRTWLDTVPVVVKVGEKFNLLELE